MRALIYDTIRRHTPPSLKRQAIKSQAWTMPLISRAFGKSIYSRSYYEQIEKSELSSVAVIADWITLTLSPRSVVDVGCGPGHLLAASHRDDVRVLGLDYSDAARECMARKKLPFLTVDLTIRADVPGVPWDVTVCCEVAEHLDERHADVFVRNLTSAGNMIFLTAAEVGQGGLSHVNEQPNSELDRKVQAVWFRAQ